MSTEIATHQVPIWQAKANFLIVADLANHGMPGRWEQIWARQIAEDEFEICCIPFFTYGLALGDIVQTTASKGRSHVITQIVKKSGRSLLRFWLKNGATTGVERIYRYLIDRSPLHEWSSVDLLVVDVPAGDNELIERLDLLVAELNQLGVEAEWGH